MDPTTKIKNLEGFMKNDECEKIRRIQRTKR